MKTEGSLTKKELFMISIKEALQKAKESYSLGLINEDGFTDIYDIGGDDGYYGFRTVLEPDEEYSESMLCVSKKDGEVSWIGGGYLYTTYDMTIIIKEPI